MIGGISGRTSLLVALTKNSDSTSAAVTVVVLFEKSYLVVNGIRPEGETGPKLSRYTENFEDKFLSDQERDSF